MYKRGARLFWKPINGAMIPGLQNGYALTAFDTENELRFAVQNYRYSELFPHYEWKVGTAETTEIRLKRMFGIKRPLLDMNDIWDRFYLPLTDRLSKYQGDIKSLEAGQCAFMREVLIKKYAATGRVAILMIPLVLGFKGKANVLEEEMSEMIVKAGGMVHNDKKEQAGKEKAAAARAQINLPDKPIDKLLKLTPTLQKMGFELHPDYKKSK
jgi:hypothetical protein